jgi:sirohydrochlorin ferrochelatase
MPDDQFHDLPADLVPADLVPDRPAPVLIGCSHGTDSAGGRAAIASILAGVRRAHPDLDVREAFVDVQQPEVADVVAGALGDGRPAVVVPLLLSAGFHVHVDVAAAVAPAGAAASGALGPDPRLVDILVDRLAAAGAGPGDTVVLAAAGSSDARAAHAVEAVAAHLRAVWSHGPVVVAYGAGCAPSVPDAVASARSAGARRVVIASYLLAPGFFHDRLLAAGADDVTEPLAPDDRLVDVVVDRYHAAARTLVPVPAH